MHRFRHRLASLLFLLALPFMQAHAATDRVEFPAWSRTLDGTIGAKAVTVTLARVDRELSGTYCYAPCTNATRYRLQLRGAVAGGTATLSERDGQSPRTRDAVTGRWRLALGDAGADGSWTSPDGRRTLPVRLRDAQPFPFEIRVVASAVPGQEGGDCGDAPWVSAIRLYRKGRLVQELPTDSQGNCDMFTPSVVDANFDGAPDLTIALTQPAGPDTPYQTWIFDPATQRFVDVPALQAVTSPQFDAAHRTVVSSWRASCCEHGVTTYRWRGTRLEQAATASSLWLPVLDGGRKRYCYSIPAYHEGRIEYPDRVEQAGGRLALTFADLSGCEAEPMLSPEPVIDIWQRAGDGGLTVVRSERTQWKRTKTRAGLRYCPEVPFFAQGKVARIVLDDPDQCSDDKP